MRAVRQLLRSLVIIIACVPHIAHAQAPAPLRPAYTPERYDEDWSFLRDASKRTDLFDPIKWIPLLKDGAWFLTLGGELRERLQAVRQADAFYVPPLVPVRGTATWVVG